MMRIRRVWVVVVVVRGMDWGNEIPMGSNCSWSVEKDTMLRKVGVGVHPDSSEAVPIRDRHPQVQAESERYWKDAYENGELGRPTWRIVNPGHGTTGTRNVDKIMSRVVRPGLHFLGPKVPKGDLTRNGIPFSWADVATDWWKTLQRCASFPSLKSECDTGRLLFETRSILKSLVQTNIVFTSDNPFTLLTMEIIEALKPTGSTPYFFWTTRDPIVWALKRVAEQSVNFMCKPDVVYKYNLSNAFDLIECLTVANSTTENPVYLSQVMVNLADVPPVQLAGAFAIHSDFLNAYLPKDRTRHYCAWDDDTDDHTEEDLLRSLLHGGASDVI